MTCTYEQGNDTWRSKMRVGWVEANIDMMTLTGTISMSKWPTGSSGEGFNSNPALKILRGDKVLTEVKFSEWDSGSYEKSFTVELDSPGEFEPKFYLYGYNSISGTYEFSEMGMEEHECIQGLGETLTAEEPPDVSELRLSYTELSSNRDFTIDVGYLVENVIKSGDGKSIEETIGISVDSNKVHSKTINIGPGEEREMNVTLTNVSMGDREVCIGKGEGYDAVNVVDNSGSPDTTVTIIVKVVNENGIPVAGEKVKLRDVGGLMDFRSGRTGKDGKVKFLESVGPPPCNSQLITLPNRGLERDMGCNNGGVTKRVEFEVQTK